MVIHSSNDIFGFGAYVSNDYLSVLNATDKGSSSCVCWSYQVSDGSGDDGSTLHFIVPVGFWFKVSGDTSAAIKQVNYYEL